MDDLGEWLALFTIVSMAFVILSNPRGMYKEFREMFQSKEDLIGCLSVPVLLFLVPLILGLTYKLLREAIQAELSVAAIYHFAQFFIVLSAGLYGGYSQHLDSIHDSVRPKLLKVGMHAAGFGTLLLFIFGFFILPWWMPFTSFAAGFFATFLLPKMFLKMNIQYALKIGLACTVVGIFLASCLISNSQSAEIW